MSSITKHSMSWPQKKLIIASSLGTVFEWYDFYLYGYLASNIASQFFSGLDKNTAFIFALIALAVGFLFRPLGALIFGHMGDRLGRKKTFLLTITIMGVSTFLVGFIPNYDEIGIIAPVLLMLLRVLQGIALGGEYGGASIYVAEFAPEHKRGAYTSWIQLTSAVGFILSISVIMLTQQIVGKASFEEWGWRIPFLLCSIFLTISVYIRLQMQESPVFMKLKTNGEISRHPILEAFGQWENLKLVLIALFSIIIPQSVMSFCGNFYVYYFLTQILKIDSFLVSSCIALGLLICIPLIIFFGRLSDQIGRKKIMLLASLLATISYFPIYYLMAKASNPELMKIQKQYPVLLHVYPKNCSWQIDFSGHRQLNSSCDIAKKSLANLGISYQTSHLPADQSTYITFANKKISIFSPQDLSESQINLKTSALEQELKQSLTQIGYPSTIQPHQTNVLLLGTLITYLLILTGMAYAPQAACLVELFPSRIRYTAMSVPYHLGNGLFGGMMPLISFSIVAQTGNIFSGLWYPIIICAICSLFAFLTLPETYQKTIDG